MHKVHMIWELIDLVEQNSYQCTSPHTIQCQNQLRSTIWEQKIFDWSHEHFDHPGASRHYMAWCNAMQLIKQLFSNQSPNFNAEEALKQNSLLSNSLEWKVSFCRPTHRGKTAEFKVTAWLNKISALIDAHTYQSWWSMSQLTTAVEQ